MGGDENVQGKYEEERKKKNEKVGSGPAFYTWWERPEPRLITPFCWKAATPFFASALSPLTQINSKIIKSSILMSVLRYYTLILLH
jgi:hypothetical protein